MSDGKTEDKKEQKTWTTQEFAKEYRELCDKTGFRIVVNPAWLARDDGSWSMVLQTSVGKMPQNN